MSGERVVASSKKVEFKGGVISDTPLTATQAADIENLIPIPHQTTGLRPREGVAPVEDLDPTATGDIAVVKVITMADKPQTRLLAVVDASGETVEVLAENRDTYGRMDPVIGVEKATIPIAWGGSWFGTDGGANARGKYIVVSFWSPGGGFCTWHMFKTTGVFDHMNSEHVYSTIADDVFVVRVSATRLAIYNTGYMDFYDISAALTDGAFNATGGANGQDLSAGYVDPEALDVTIHEPIGTATIPAWASGYETEAVSVDASGTYLLMSASDGSQWATRPAHHFRVVNTATYVVTSTSYTTPDPTPPTGWALNKDGKSWGHSITGSGLVVIGLAYNFTKLGETTTYHVVFNAVNPLTGAAVGSGVTFTGTDGEMNFRDVPVCNASNVFFFHDNGGIMVDDDATTAVAVPNITSANGIIQTMPLLSTQTQVAVYRNSAAKYDMLSEAGVLTALNSGPSDWEKDSADNMYRVSRVNDTVFAYHNVKTDPTPAYTQIANADYYGLEAIDTDGTNIAINPTSYNASVGVIDAFLYYQTYIAGTLT